MAREREQIMLAYPYTEDRLLKWFQECESILIQPKVEGDRCRAEIDDHGKVTLFSSSARVIESVPHINKALESLRLPKIELDGELYKHGMPHEEIRSRVSRTVGKHPNYEEIEYHVYDIVNEHRQHTRNLQLTALWSDLQVPEPLILVPTWSVQIIPEIERVYDWLIDQGYEGAIFRHPRAPYVRKRATTMMKLKPRLSGIYSVRGFEEEHTIQGEPKNALGALELRDGFGNIFKVGTGFTRQQREEIWKSRDKYLEKQVKIRYQDVTVNGVPKMSSFERFVESEMSETEGR